MSLVKFLKMKLIVRQTNNFLGQTASSFTWDLFSAMGVVFSVNNFDRTTALQRCKHDEGHAVEMKWSFGKHITCIRIYVHDLD